MAQEFRPDVVILDLAMPEMNGLEAARLLKQLMPEIPLLMFTTHVVPGLEKAIASGFREVISKSDGPPAVIKAIRTLLAAQGSRSRSCLVDSRSQPGSSM
jgi:CheY-like chemotaxis protein